MRDFVEFCASKDLIDIHEDGTITWKEAAVKGPKRTSHKEKLGGGRDQRQDLSDDYKDYAHNMGTVWPFKIVAKGKK